MEQQQGYYSSTVPVEPPAKHPGRTEGIISIICAVIALGFFPPVFGVVGIVLGARCLKKGNQSLGIIAIILSAVFMVIGMILGAGMSMLNKTSQGAIGFILQI